MKEFRYLTFDCYGTLIDWKEGIENSLEGAFGKLPLKGRALLQAYLEAEMKEEEGYQKYREVLRRTALGLSKQLGLEVNDEVASRFAGSVPYWPAFADSARVLQELGTRGYKRYILSNVDTELLEETIRKWELEVDGFVTAEQVGSYKPKEEHWLRFMKKTSASKKEILHVAQSLYHDILPAQRLGIATVWVNRYREPLLPDAQPSYIVESLSDLALILDSATA